jgi:hypothetical protein
MKKTIRLTESDLIRLVNKVINEQVKATLTPSNQSSNLQLTTNVQARNDNYRKNELGPNLDADDIADIVSGLVDVIPGIGNLISAGIDVTHGLTYVVRYSFAKTMEEKIETSLMAIVTFATAMIPVGGNAANVFAKQEIKSLMHTTPYQLRVIAKELGLIKFAGWDLAKQPWKYSFVIALVKIFKSKTADALTSVSTTLANLSNNSKDLKPYIDDFNKQIKEAQTLIS